MLMTANLDATEIMRALLEWLRPHQNSRWLILGDAPPTALRLLDAQTAASEMVVVNRVDALNEFKSRASVLNASAQRFDAALFWRVLDDEQDAAALVARVARVTRLYGALVAVSARLERRVLWDLWLDARLNDVSTRALADTSGWMVRGTR